VEFPRIVVVARAGGAPPDLFITTVTRPLEQALTSTLGVQRIRSKTIRGATEISLQFAPNTDMWRALQLTEARIAEVRSSLPSETEVIVERVTTGSFPILTFNVAGPVDPRDLRELAEFVVRPALANVPGVGRIEVLGGDVREVEVILKPEATAALRLSPAQVAEKLQVGLGLSSVGRFDEGRQLVTVISDALPRNLKEISDMPIAISPDGSGIAVGAIAEVVEGHEDRTIRIGGPKGETASISVARLPGASTPAVIDAATAAVRALSASFPSGVTVEPVYDQGLLVRESMASVRDAILLGIVLCALVIGLFLRDVRAGLLAGIAVPLTLAITFLPMYVGHQTLNLMSLGGMAVAIGLVVDDAIVIVEAIARRRDAGANPSVAAILGSADLSKAVIGTTLTTVVVLIPLAFLEGVVGDFFRALAFALTAAVLLSLGVALVLVPLASSFSLSSKKQATTSALFRFYEPILHRILARPGLALLGFVSLIVAGVLLTPQLKRGFLPSVDESAFVLDYFLPAGTSLATTDQFAQSLEKELAATPEVRTFTRRTGAELGPAAATQLNRGDIMVRLALPRERRRSAEDIIADLRSRAEARYPEVRVEFVQVLQDVLNDLAGNPRPIEIKLLGQDYTELNRLGSDLAKHISNIPGLVDIYNGQELPVPELHFGMQRDAIARIGSTPDELTRALDAALRGTRVGGFRRFDRLIGIRTRYPDTVRFDPAHVLDLPFIARDSTTNFRAVTDINRSTSSSQLLHEALQPLVAVTGDHEHRDLGAVADDVENVVRQLHMPAGYRTVLGGQIASQRDTLRQLTYVGGMGLLLVLTVLAAQFRRLRFALLVIAMVPVAIVGAILSLVATGTALNAASLMGCVLLVGLVVKNGVLLLEEAENQLALGATVLNAVTSASERRLRPVVMTTVATLAGLFPLALGIGAGSEMQRPLAIAVIGGLLTSTAATLGFVPPFAVWLLRRQSSPRVD
jgi:CzcA family heavy metal efflux pump